MGFTKETLADLKIEKNNGELLESSKKKAVNTKSDKHYKKHSPSHNKARNRELDNVSGGGCGKHNPPSHFEVGDYVSVPDEYAADANHKEFAADIIQIKEKTYKNGEWYYDFEYLGKIIKDVKESLFL